MISKVTDIGLKLQFEVNYNQSGYHYLVLLIFRATVNVNKILGIFLLSSKLTCIDKQERICLRKTRVFAPV